MDSNLKELLALPRAERIRRGGTVISKREGHGWVAEVDVLPGCVGYGDTEAGAVEAARARIESFLAEHPEIEVARTRLRLLDPVVKRAIAQLLELVETHLRDFADSLAHDDVLDPEDLQFEGYGKAAVAFVNRQLHAKGLHLNTEHPLGFLVRNKEE